MQRNRHDGVEGFGTRQGRGQQLDQRLSERTDAPVLEEMNPFAQPAFVGAEAVGGIKSAEAVAAQSAAALVIQGKGILKRCAAGYTRVAGDEALWRMQTSGAEGNSGGYAQRLTANAAIIGKNQGKKGVKGCLNR